VVGEQPIWREMFESLAEQMDYLGLEHVAEIHPTEITAYAGILAVFLTAVRSSVWSSTTW
jgi:hypothetical protein